MMKRRADGLGCWLALAVMFFLLSSFSKATAAGWTIHQDGRLTVDSFTYSSFSHYFQSDAFKQSGRRCGTVRPPFRLEPFAVPSDCGLNQSANLDEYGPAQIYEIPVVVHIIMQSDGVGNISDSRVASQIEILNEDYMAIFGTPGGNGTDGGVRFRLATVDPSGNPTTGITRTTNNNWFHDNDEYGFKSALGWDQSRYLNIFTNSAGGYLGYAYFPQAYAGTVRDGVVILYSAFGRDSGYPPYDQGRTATHEVGHYLGLEHTFEGGCQSHMSPECYSSGDLICDTNSEQEPAYGCPQGRVTCNSPDPIHNYMDYSNDTCMTNYTPQQVRRMRCALEHYRSALYKVVPYLDADFIAERTRGIQPLTVSFTDTSIGTIDSYTWDFGDGATSTLRNPSHTYLQAGNFTVSLSVTGPWGTDTETKSKFVHVLETFPSGLFELLLLENRPYLQLSGTSHSFGNIRLDSHADWKLTVRNGGSADLTISAYTGLPSNGFDLLNGPTPPFSIPSKGSVEFEIRYHPSSWGLNRATFTIHSNAENAPIATVSLKGYCLFYEIVDLGTLGGNESSARAINDMGCIVGRSKTPDGDFHAFFWDTINGMQDIGTAGYTSSGASDINNLNQVSGTTQTPPRAFVWDDENGIQYLSRIESPDLSAAGINDAGMIVGSFESSTDYNKTFPYIWDPDNPFIFEKLGSLGGDRGWAVELNELEQVAGVSEDADGRKLAFIWDRINGMRSLGTLGEGHIAANDINNVGQVVGAFQLRVNYIEKHAFIWDPVNGMQDVIDRCGSLSNSAYAINDLGYVVGSTSDTLEELNIDFLYADGETFDLNELILNRTDSLYLLGPTDINILGEIVGIGMIGDEHHAVWLKRVLSNN